MSVCPRAMVEGVRSRRSAVGCSEGPPLLREYLHFGCVRGHLENRDTIAGKRFE